MDGETFNTELLLDRSIILNVKILHQALQIECHSRAIGDDSLCKPIPGIRT
jgi:hypothetical protein